LIIVFTSAKVNCGAQETQNSTQYYTLDQVIALAQKKSSDALINIHSFRSSYWSYRSFKAGYMPNLSFNAKLPGITRTIEEVVQNDGSVDYRERNNASFRADMALTQKVGLTGGTLYLQSGLQRLDNNFLTGTKSTQYLSSPISFGIVQPIFSYNAYKWDKIIEPMMYNEAKREFLEQNEEVAVTAINHFFNLLNAQLTREISYKNESNYDTLYKIAQGRFVLGKIAENELLQLELNLLNAQIAVENAELNYNNALFIFKSYIRTKDNAPIILVPPIVKSFFTINNEEAITQATQNTSSILSYERQIWQARSDVAKAKHEGRFSADLSASFGLTQTSDKLLDVYKNPLDEEIISIDLSIPILDWGQARGRIRMAESKLDMVQTQMEQNQIDFNQNINLKVQQFNMQQNQLFIAAKSDTVAQKRFDITRKRYMIGQVNDVLELNNAQIDNDKAKMSYYDALKTYWLIFYEIRRSTLYDFLNLQKIDFSPENVIVK
jgi:Outer membrane protein